MSIFVSSLNRVFISNEIQNFFFELLSSLFWRPKTFRTAITLKEHTWCHKKGIATGVMANPNFCLIVLVSPFNSVLISNKIPHFCFEPIVCFSHFPRTKRTVMTTKKIVRCHQKSIPTVAMMKLNFCMRTFIRSFNRVLISNKIPNFNLELFVCLFSHLLFSFQFEIFFTNVI